LNQFKRHDIDLSKQNQYLSIQKKLQE